MADILVTVKRAVVVIPLKEILAVALAVYLSKQLVDCHADDHNGIGEYSEAYDEYFLPLGWYETSDNPPTDCAMWPIVVAYNHYLKSTTSSLLGLRRRK